MKANELMIGDWVYSRQGVPSRVTSITCDGIIETEDGVSNIEIAEPIPITPEVLIKIGFKKLKSAMGREYYEIPMENALIQYNTDFSGRIQGPNRNFEFLNVVFLHELQHALRLCKIEKEIEL